MKIPASVALALARGIAPATGALMARLQNGHMVPMGSANSGVAYDRPRWPGRTPTGVVAYSPGAFTPPSSLSGYENIIGTTAIRGDAADVMRASVSRLGVAGTRMDYPRAFGLPGVEGPRFALRDTPARSIIATSELWTGSDGAYVPLRYDGPAPGTPATPSTLITPGSAPASEVPMASAWSAPSIVDAPTAGGSADYFPAPLAFQSGSTSALAPCAPPADYTPTGSSGDPGGSRIMECEARPPSGSRRAPSSSLVKTGLALFAVALVWKALKR